MSELATKSELRTSLRQYERTLDARIARLEAKQSDDRMNKRVWESTISLGALLGRQRAAMGHQVANGRSPDFAMRHGGF